MKLLILIMLYTLPTTNTGVVKYYIEDNGFGYIIDDKTKDEVVVYDKGIVDEIKEGNKVKYNIKNTRKGYEAYDVKLQKQTKK